MSRQSKILWMLGVLALAVACVAPPASSAETGLDESSGSVASITTWTDGQKAYAISCEVPQGCNQRANAVCKNGSYKVLSIENMPSAGDVVSRVMGKPAIVIRCG